MCDRNIKLTNKGIKMVDYMLEKKPPRYSLIVSLKDEIEKRRVIELLPHNLHCFDTGLTKMVAVKEDNQIVYKSKERLKLIKLDNRTIQLESEEFSYALAICAFLNDFEIDYELDSGFNEYQKKACRGVTDDNLDEEVESWCWDDACVAKDIFNI